MITSAVPLTEGEQRRLRLVLLHDELARAGLPVRLVKHRRAGWSLRVGGRWSSRRIVCAGAAGAYVYITQDGLIVGPAVAGHHPTVRRIGELTRRGRRARR